MGVLESMRLAALSARSLQKLGPAVSCKWASAASCTQIEEGNRDLLLRFHHLTLSPLEAQLSAQVKASAKPLVDATHYRLPGVLKSATVIVPTLSNTVLIEKDLPSVLNIMEKIEPIVPEQTVDVPFPKLPEKQAARMIVIRRKKMKKHKLRKLRKKMRYVWLKMRQKREYQKEKLFQATQMARVRQYEAFDAVKYVSDVLQLTKAKPVPRTWKGKRLPQFIIKDLMEKERLKKIKNKQECLEREELQKIKDNYTNKL